MNLFSTTITPEAIEEVNNTLKSGMISAGKKAEEFEKLLAERGLKNPVTVNSGTSALHLALIAAGVKEGDEVITQAQTFIATGLAILYCKAKPVFVDINPLTGNINEDLIEGKITNKTKAIMVVDWGGYPCDLDKIMDIGKKYNLKVIEDAAHSFGAFYKNRPIGSIVDFTCFSFQSIKHLVSGDGGCVCSLNEEDTKLLKRLRWFDIDRENSNIGFLGEREYDAVNIGYKYHMNDVTASIGIGNLKQIDSKLNRIQEIAQIYKSYISKLDSLQVSNLSYSDDRVSSYWLYPILVNNRDKFIKFMKNNDIPVSVVHQGIDKYSIFNEDGFLPNQRYYDSYSVCLPINDSLTDNDIKNVCDLIGKFVEEKDFLYSNVYHNVVNNKYFMGIDPYNNEDNILKNNE